MKAKLCEEELSEAHGGAQGRRRWLQRPQVPPDRLGAHALQWTVEWRSWGGEDCDMPHPTPHPRSLVAEREEKKGQKTGNS